MSLIRRVICLLLVFTLTLGTAAAHGVFHDETHVDHSTCATDAAEAPAPDWNEPDPCAGQACASVGNLNTVPSLAAPRAAAGPIVPSTASVPSVAPDRLLRPPRLSA